MLFITIDGKDTVYSHMPMYFPGVIKERMLDMTLRIRRTGQSRCVVDTITRVIVLLVADAGLRAGEMQTLAAAIRCAGADSVEHQAPEPAAVSDRTDAA